MRIPKLRKKMVDLLTREEARALLDAAKYDVDQFRRHGIERHLRKHGSAGMRPAKDNFPALLAVYHGTGARTTELVSACVGDFSPRTRQLVFKKHKRSTTQKVATVRHLNLDEEALTIVQDLARGRPGEEFLFLRPWGKPWTKKTVNVRLHSVQRVAEGLGATFRHKVTVYDFRHLWISECLMAGVDVLTVARMAGTSVRMVETVYGHFRGDHFQAAQRLLTAVRASGPTSSSPG